MKASLDENGHEVVDPRPLSPPVGYRRQPSLAEQIRDMVRSERLAREVAESGMETFAEADDFDVGDDFDPRSPFEGNFDPVGVLQERMRQAEAGARPPGSEPAGPSSDVPAGSDRPPAAPAAGSEAAPKAEKPAAKAEK